MCVTEAAAGAAHLAILEAQRVEAERRRAAQEAEAKRREKEKKIPSLRDFKTDLQHKVTTARDEKAKKLEAAALSGVAATTAPATPPPPEPARPAPPDAEKADASGAPDADPEPPAAAATTTPGGGPADSESAGEGGGEDKAREPEATDADAADKKGGGSGSSQANREPSARAKDPSADPAPELPARKKTTEPVEPAEEAEAAGGGLEASSDGERSRAPQDGLGGEAPAGLAEGAAGARAGNGGGAGEVGAGTVGGGAAAAADGSTDAAAADAAGSPRVPPPPPLPRDATPGAADAGSKAVKESDPVLLPASKETAASFESQYNYAASFNGAKIVSHNPEGKSASAALREDLDSYFITPCQAKAGKWLVVELSEAATVTAVTLANYEFHSSGAREFELRGLGPGLNPEDEGAWRTLAVARADQARERQTFVLPPKAQAWVKFVRVEVTGHYGAFHFCTLSLVRVHGKDATQTLKEEMEAIDTEVQEVEEILKEAERTAEAERAKGNTAAEGTESSSGRSSAEGGSAEGPPAEGAELADGDRKPPKGSSDAGDETQTKTLADDAERPSSPGGSADDGFADPIPDGDGGRDGEAASSADGEEASAPGGAGPGESDANAAESETRQVGRVRSCTTEPIGISPLRGNISTTTWLPRPSGCTKIPWDGSSPRGAADPSDKGSAQ